MLPEKLASKVKTFCEKNPEAKPIFDELIAHFHANDPQPPDAKAVLKDALQIKNMTLLLPERRKVILGIQKSGFVIVCDTKVLYQGSWQTYDLALCLPLPNKQKHTFSLVLASRRENVGDKYLFTVLDQAADKFLDGARPVPLREMLKEKILPYTGIFITEPGLVVEANRGSKEGILYFLDKYIVYGFKKPLLVLALDIIANASFTVITHHSFNIVISTSVGESYEFSIMSHDFYEPISEYLRTNEVPDDSLNETRAAKRAKTGPSALEIAEREAKGQPQQEPFDSEDEENDANFETQSSGSDSDSEGSA